MAKKLNYAAMFTLRKDGRYQKIITVDGNPKAVYDRDPEKLFYKIQELENPQPPSFKDVAEAWHDTHWEKIQNGTKTCYESRYKDALDEQEGKLITDVTAADIDRHLKRLSAKGLSAKSVKTQRTVYKLIFNFAIISEDRELRGFVTSNPAAVVSVPRGLPKKTREAPEDDIINKIRQSSGLYFGLFPYLLLYTGFRKGEALALTWGDIDFKNKTIKCNKSVSHVGGAPVLKLPKTAAGIRTVPLLDDLEKVLKRPKGAKDADPIFPRESGGYLWDDKYNARWLHYCKEAGFVRTMSEERESTQGKKYVYTSFKPSITAHQLRHAYATILFEAGVDEYTAQKLLGHADIQTTRAIYTHLRDKQESKSISKLKRYLSAEQKKANNNEALANMKKTMKKAAGKA